MGDKVEPHREFIEKRREVKIFSRRENAANHRVSRIFPYQDFGRTWKQHDAAQTIQHAQMAS